MTGVEILSKSPIMEYGTWTFVVAFIATIAIGVIGGIWCKSSNAGLVFAIATFFICAIIFGIFEVGYCETGKYTYKVTIDDSVSINEFLDKYEILDQEGKIYTIKEKEN